MKREPVILTALASVIVTAAASYGLELTTDQMLAVFALVQAIAAWVARSRVSPVPSPEPVPVSKLVHLHERAERKKVGKSVD